MAHASDASETRTLHPLALPARLSDPGAAELRRGLYVDCETTGFSPEHDAVIELALLPFTYTLAGTVVEVLHDEAQAHRNDPGRALPAEITHLTGLTDDDVRGERIDVEAASALIERSGLIVAHNARFDRPFVERVLPAARARPWACTRAEVPWTAEGFASQALHCLLCAYGVYARDRHRALADCEAGVWLLAQRLPVSGDSLLAAMRRRALTPTVRLWAIRSPFESRRRYARGTTGGCRRCGTGSNVRGGPTLSPMRWRASSRGFARRSTEGRGGYLPPGGIPQRRVTAFERWRTDPSDLAHPAPLAAGAFSPAAA